MKMKVIAPAVWSRGWRGRSSAWPPRDIFVPRPRDDDFYIVTMPRADISLNQTEINRLKSTSLLQGSDLAFEVSPIFYGIVGITNKKHRV